MGDAGVADLPKLAKVSNTGLGLVYSLGTTIELMYQAIHSIFQTANAVAHLLFAHAQACKLLLTAVPCLGLL